MSNIKLLYYTEYRKIEKLDTRVTQKVLIISPVRCELCFLDTLSKSNIKKTWQLTMNLDNTEKRFHRDTYDQGSIPLFGEMLANSGVQ